MSHDEALLSRPPAHEPIDDVSWPYTLAILGAVFLAIGLVLAGSTWQYWSLESHTDRTRLNSLRPVEPRESTRDLEQLRAAEQRQLSELGWVSRERGIARIPIEKAIDLWLQEQQP